MKNTQRFFALDSLRAIMMLLGVVIHAAVNYVHAPLNTYLLKDPSSSRWFDVLVFLIHSFRMPLFFILAGFFAAMLVEKQGMRGMLHNRYKRIALPFIAFWLVLFPLIAIIMLNGFHLMEKGSWGIDIGLAPQDPEKPQFTTMHLWFLHYLIIFYAPAAVFNKISAICSQPVRNTCLNRIETYLKKPVGLVFLTIPIALSGFFYPFGVVEITGSFVPDGPQILFHGIFFTTGWLVFLRMDLLDHFRRHYKSFCLWASLNSFLSLMALGFLTEGPENLHFIAKISASFLANLTTWLWCFGLTGLFIEKWDRFSPVMRYLTDSAYWVYLIHIVFTTSFALALFQYQAN
ncbi:MAG: acyltransferase family protein, partial [Pseudomonadales bacterium]|nr:acyltransferase family protein [Pseudomonadales bacterium]